MVIVVKEGISIFLTDRHKVAEREGVCFFLNTVLCAQQKKGTDK